MTNQIKTVNPILPLKEFIPDVEARVFRGSDGQERLFLYGSHDEYDMDTWCSYQYRVYSAPTANLGDWTDHGVSFASRKGEGYIWNGEECDGVAWTDEILYAPDVLQMDGRYWLCSCFSGGGLGMSVSDCPEGPFCPATRIIYDRDGKPLGSIDPALYAEDGKVYLIWGQRTSFGGEGLVGVELEKNEAGIYAVAKYDTKRYLFGNAQNPDQGFGFYEGPSIRKIGETYYIIYPSDKGKGVHMMSYATADSPLGPYVFRGNILDNDGCDLESGNNHGSLCEINGKWYLFYHRGFGNSNMRRKVCVEEIQIEEDGSIRQTEMTNHGFGGSLSPYDRVEAAYVTSVRPKGSVSGCYLAEYGDELHPLVNIRNGNCVAYKDFDFGEASGKLVFAAKLQQKNGGMIEIVLDDPSAEAIGTLTIEAGKSDQWIVCETAIVPVTGVHTLYLRFQCKHRDTICELAAFQFRKEPRDSSSSDVLASVWLSDNGDGTYTNGLLWGDYPDNDVIRVGDTYYMISTSMHLFPGCPVMSSKDLIHWRYESYALPYDQLLQLANKGHTLELHNGEAYDLGAWAASIRYNNKLKKFYFLVNIQDGTPEEYAVLSVADQAAGPWKLYRLGQRLYDPGLFFEEDGTAYVVHGQGQLYLSRLMLVEEKTGECKIDPSFAPANEEGQHDRPFYHYEGGSYNEGSHVYKADGVYYVLTTPTWKGTDTKKEICIQTKDLVNGPYEVRDVHKSFMNFGENGIHQGGIVDVPTEDGTCEWWSIIFQDRHKLGRTPTLQPVYWETDETGLKWPMIGEKGTDGTKAVTTYQKPVKVEASDMEQAPEDVRYFDGFDSDTLDLCWQWNHIPNDARWSLTQRPGYIRLYTATVTTILSQAQNTLRQRVIGPASTAVIQMDISQMSDGDCAGLAVHQKEYTYIGITYDAVQNQKILVVNDNGTEAIREVIPGGVNQIWLRAEAVKMEYRVEFSYSLDGLHFTRLGGRYDMHYGWYVGMGYGIFNFAEKDLGGYVDIDSFTIYSPYRNRNDAHFGSKIEAELYDDQQDITTAWTADYAYTDLLTKWGSAYDLAISFSKEGAWAQYNRVDIGNGSKWFNARVSAASSGGILEVHQGSPDGKLLAQLSIPATEGEECFQNVVTKIDPAITGMQKLFLVYRGSDTDCRLNWFQLGAGEPPMMPDVPEAAVRALGADKAEISWKPAEHALEYDIRFCSASINKIISNVSSPFVETSDGAGSSCKVSVRSKNYGGYSDWSKPIEKGIHHAEYF